MHLIAHRGLTNEYIGENTLKAFKNAINNEYEGIELDIRKKDIEIKDLEDKIAEEASKRSKES